MAIDTIEGEVWKDIKTIPYHQAEWPFHQVSNKGRIRVLPGGTVNKRPIKTIELRKLTLRDDGYLVIRKNLKTYFLVHHVVLNTLVGPCPPGQECRHLNGNKSDNRWPENITWGTKEDNAYDKVLHGTNNDGERNGGAKLTESDMRKIRSTPHSYGIGKRLAAQYGVSQAIISLIRNGKKWKRRQ